MITEKGFWKGRDKTHAGELTDEVRANAYVTIDRVNKLLAYLGYPGPYINDVTSGWRPPSINARTPGAAAKSSHVIGKAVDLADPDGKIKQAIQADPKILQRFRLNMEDPAATPGWCHLDTRESLGYRIFRIYA